MGSRWRDASIDGVKYAEGRTIKEAGNGNREPVAGQVDQRRTSGFSSIYSLLRLIKAHKGQVFRYDWGITDQHNSTVTYAGRALF